MKTCIILLFSILAVHQSLMATDNEMIPYSVDLPQHNLRFKLPKEIVARLSGAQIHYEFNTKNPLYIKNGFYSVAEDIFFFNGPIWTGLYGDFRFDFMIVKKLSDLHGDILTINGLSEYLRWWLSKDGQQYNFNFENISISGSPWVRRWKDMLNQRDGGASGEAEDNEILSCPLDENMFLQVAFQIRDSHTTRSLKWREQAYLFREAIKATIVVEPKKTEVESKTSGH